MVTRPCAVAGLFYPDDAPTLRETLAHMLNEATHSGPPPKVLIAPHAGYVYSGPVAASGYSQLRPDNQHIRRVVLIGPAHRVYFRGVALSSAAAFQTPLGAVAVDEEALSQLRGTESVSVHDEAHRQEHSLEVHLPFLQHTLGEFELVPMLVGDIDTVELGRLIDSVWGGAETLIVVSTDLSHFLNYDEAKKIDAATSTHIEQARSGLSPEQACGCRGLNAVLDLVREKRLRVTTLDVRNSGDTAGARDRVVGYGSYVAA